MSANAVSTQYLSSCFVLPVQQAQSQLATLTTEESTGQYADLGLQLGDQSGYELSLKEDVQQINALTAGNSVVGTNLSTAQNALTSISDSASTTASNLAEWTSGTSSGSELQTMGEEGLGELIAAANTTSGDAYVFGGVNSSTAPLADYFSSSTSAAKSAVDQAFEQEFGCLPTDAAAASITASQMQSFLSGSFADLFSGSNWTTDWSSASSVNTTAEIAPGETATTSTNTNTTAFQSLAEAYTMLTEFGGSELSDSAQAAVASAATSLITSGQTALTQTQASLGAAQSQITDANSMMSNQLTLIDTQLNALDDVDQNATAASITTLTDQIVTAYELTNTLHELNLAQYLPVS
jgi:flagellar hook-associated protein 3 FlgL